MLIFRLLGRCVTLQTATAFDLYCCLCFCEFVFVWIFLYFCVCACALVWVCVAVIEGVCLCICVFHIFVQCVFVSDYSYLMRVIKKFWQFEKFTENLGTLFTEYFQVVRAFSLRILKRKYYLKGSGESKFIVTLCPSEKIRYIFLGIPWNLLRGYFQLHTVTFATEENAE